MADAAQYVDIATADGTLRVVYELSIGDMLVCSLLLLLLVFLILQAVMTAIWRRR